MLYFLQAFLQAYNSLVSGDSGMIAESSITPASGLPTMEDVKDAPSDKVKSLLEQTVVLKLNGGLGTGMGLEQVQLPSQRRTSQAKKTLASSRRTTSTAALPLNVVFYILHGSQLARARVIFLAGKVPPCRQGKRNFPRFYRQAGHVFPQDLGHGALHVHEQLLH